MIITVDGPAGAGKSTICKLLAKKLGYVYLDTGAMYRAMAWALLREKAPIEDGPELDAWLPRMPLRFTLEAGFLTIAYDEHPLEDEIREPYITQWSSRLSQLKAVRAFLTLWQQRLGAQGSLVAEGRDMGTVVFPHAPVKIFLTADLAARALRRQAEYGQKGVQMELDELEKQMHSRDEADSRRAMAPLRPAPDAVVVDTTRLSIPEVVDQLMEIIAEKSGSRR